MSIAPSKIPVGCPQCGKQLMVPVSAAGKQGRCPSCSNVFVLPALVAAEEVEDDLRLEPLASDPFGSNAPVSNHQLQSVGPQAYAAPVANYGSAAAPQNANPYQAPVNPYMANAYAEAAAKPAESKYGGGLAPEQRGWDMGMVGGLLMMLIAVVWFVGGLFFDIIFFYPPILFIIGLIGFFRGLVTGNVSGD